MKQQMLKLNPMLIRPLTACERGNAKNFYLSLSADDRRKRFCCALADETIARYVDRFDYTRDTMLGVFDGQAQIIGLAELVTGPKDSEMAFSVRPDRRGQKIGTLLMERLIAHASRCGVRKVYVIFVSDNTPMRKMASRAGMPVHTEDGESHAARELPLPGAESAGRRFDAASSARGGYSGIAGLPATRLLVDQSNGKRAEPRAERARALVSSA
jgi:GNAT superfamily N-acetyltransferase